MVTFPVSNRFEAETWQIHLMLCINLNLASLYTVEWISQYASIPLGSINANIGMYNLFSNQMDLADLAHCLRDIMPVFF